MAKCLMIDIEKSNFSRLFFLVLHWNINKSIEFCADEQGNAFKCIDHFEYRRAELVPRISSSLLSSLLIQCKIHIWAGMNSHWLHVEITVQIVVRKITTRKKNQFFSPKDCYNSVYEEDLTLLHGSKQVEALKKSPACTGWYFAIYAQTIIVINFACAQHYWRRYYLIFYLKKKRRKLVKWPLKQWMNRGKMVNIHHFNF